MSVTDRVAESAIERVDTLSDKINRTYDRVFGDPDVFKQYFFSTPDNTVEDAQIRLGVFLKRLNEDDSERFWFLRQHYRGTEFGPTSIHNLDDDGRSNFLPNGHISAEIDEWRKKQPSQIEQEIIELAKALKDRFQLKAPEGFSFDGPVTIYNYPHLELTPEAMNEVVQLVLPDCESKPATYSSIREVSIKTPKFKCDVLIRKNEAFGDYFSVSFGHEPIVIDDGIKAEYAKYYQSDAVPTIVENAIKALNPQDIKKHVTGSNLLEGVVWTPNTYSKGEGRKERNGFYTGGYGVDLHVRPAEELGLIPRGKDFDHTFPGGWFITEEQLWHALFGTDFPGQFSVKDPNMDSVALAIRDPQVPSTHQMVLNNIGNDDNGHRYKDFIKEAETVLGGYRYFTSADLQKFMFPEGFQPAAVCQDGSFALGIRQVEGGIEICFRVPNEVIVAHIENMQAGNIESINRLKRENRRLEKIKRGYK